MSESDSINEYVKRLEKKLQWGQSAQWSAFHYKKLSREILDKTSFSISVVTLKRIVGKEKTGEKYTPYIETKNALARFLDYSDWIEYKKSLQKDNEVSKEQETEIKQPIDSYPLPAEEEHRIASEKKTYSLNKKWIIAGLVIFGGVVSCIIYFFSAKTKTTPMVNFTYKLTQHVTPLTAMFHYEVSNINKDSAYIYFEERAYAPEKNMQKLDFNNGVIAHFYKIPDYYVPKLIYHNKVIGQVRIHALSDGWETGVAFSGEKERYAPNYYYQFPEKHFSSDTGMLCLSLKDIENIPFSTPYFAADFRNIRDFDASLDDCSFEFSVKLFDKDCNNSMYGMVTYLIGENDRQFGIPIAPKNSIESIGVEVEDTFIDGSFHDLSAFGQDLSYWRRIKIESKNKKVKIYVDDQLIYSMAYQKPIGKLKGIVFRIKNCIAIDYVKLYDGNGKSVYEDPFD